MPASVTWDPLAAYFLGIPNDLKRTISPSNIPEMPAKDRVRMLWCCYRESPVCAQDFPDHFAAFQLEN